MRTQKLFISLYLMLLFPGMIFSQKETFNDILSVQVRNIGTIENDNEVTGHYIFYKTEKIDRKTNAYKLSIMNQDLVTIKNIEKTGSNALTLLECIYNGKAILLKYMDIYKRELEFEIYNDKGDLSYSKKIKISEHEYNTIIQMKNSDNEILSNGLSTIGTKGFIDLASTKNKKYKYEVRYFDSEDSTKNWIVESPNEKGLEAASFIVADTEKIVLNVMKRNSLFSTDIEFFTTVLSTENGEILKEYDNTKLGNYVFFKGYTGEKGNIRLIGNYFKDEDSPIKDHPLGIISYTLSENNELIDKKKATFGRLLKKKSDEKDPGHIHFHDFILTDSNKIYVIGEYFKKTADAGGIALAALGSPTSVVKLSIYDFVVAELNADLKVEKIKVFDKKKHSVGLPQSALFLGSATLGNYVKLYGGYDYRYTQLIKGEKPYFISTYFDRADENDKEPKFKIVSNIDGSFSEDAVSLKTEATDIIVSKAKPGHILITEYFKKEKKMTLRLEKINI